MEHDKPNSALWTHYCSVRKWKISMTKGNNHCPICGEKQP